VLAASSPVLEAPTLHALIPPALRHHTLAPESRRAARQAAACASPRHGGGADAQAARGEGALVARHGVLVAVHVGQLQDALHTRPVHALVSQVHQHLPCPNILVTV
jgi:hypothetical protein